MGIGFAIPANMVRTVIVAAKRGGTTVKRPWLGASLQNVTKDIADSIGLDRPTGALVANVFENGPAAAAGLERGDVIGSVDGRGVDDTESVVFRLAEKSLGDTASLGILRSGHALTLDLKLAAAPEIPPRDAIEIRSRSPFDGALVVNISPAVIEEMSLNSAHEGVVVASVGEDSTAAEVGVQKGDVVLKVNGETIATTHDLEHACAKSARAWDLTIQRGGEVIRSRLGG
jgi:S1-C subfamily serine protease